VSDRREFQREVGGKNEITNLTTGNNVRDLIVHDRRKLLFK
jgi:hypothetical protein